MKNFLIGVLLVAVIALVYLQFKPKSTVVSNNTIIPSGQTTTNNNLNTKDYQPSVTNTTSSVKTISDTKRGFSFGTVNGGVATEFNTRGESGWNVQSTNGDEVESIEVLSADINTWSAKYIDTRIYGKNTVKIYKFENGAYEFVIGKVVVTSTSNPPKYIDLSSVTF